MNASPLITKDLSKEIDRYQGLCKEVCNIHKQQLKQVMFALSFTLIMVGVCIIDSFSSKTEERLKTSRNYNEEMMHNVFSGVKREYNREAFTLVDLGAKALMEGLPRRGFEVMTLAVDKIFKHSSFVRNIFPIK